MCFICAHLRHLRHLRIALSSPHLYSTLECGGLPLLLLVIIVLALLFFGGNRLGDAGKGLGESVRSFKDAFKDDEPKKPL
jgi:TatA/E family protein of Tat protein translocase